MEYEHITHSFKPVYDENSRILIGPAGHRSPSDAARHLPRIGGVCLAEGGK